MRRNLTAFALLLALGLALGPALPAEAAAWGAVPVDTVSARLTENAGLEVHTYWEDGDYLTESYIEVAPGGTLKPVAYSNDTLCSVAPMETAAAAVEARDGVTVAAGINGGFYTVATEVPVGVVVRDGALRSWSSADAWMDAIGFQSDGSVRFGKLVPELTLEAGDKVLAVNTLNQARSAGAALFTDDFDAKTRASGFGWNLVCVPSRSTVPLNGEVELRVEGALSSGKGRVDIPAGRWVLSLAGEEDAEPPAWLGALSSGSLLRLSVSCPPGWETVESAVGLMYTLVENGAVCPDLETKRAPRSAVGVKADGSLVLYTVDGRQEGYSVGAGLDDVARRMLELGCVSAGALDGGGSTSLRAVMPGSNDLNQVNRPSDKDARKVVNYIFLVKSARPTGQASRLVLYPLDLDIMAGVEAELTVQAVDAYGYPAPVPSGLAFTVSGGLGTVVNGAFRGEVPGSGEISVQAPGVEGASIPVTVVTEPQELRIYGEQYGRLVETLTLDPGQEVDLTVRSYYNHVTLTGKDECYLWETDAAAGTVDGTGHLTAALTGGHGTLRVSAGAAEVQIPIHVTSGLPFEDVSVDDIYYPAVKYTYDRGIFIGTGNTIFDPAVVLNRAMLVTVLWRIHGEKNASALPGFLDVAPESWYGPAVAWAAEQGIVNGYSPEVFAPEDDLTREQFITILHRCAGLPRTGFAPGVLPPDTWQVSDWALDAMAWGSSTGVALSEADGNLLPAAPVTRAEVAEILTRWLTLPEPEPGTAPEEGTQPEPEQVAEPGTEPEQEQGAELEQGTEAEQGAEPGTEQEPGRAAQPEPGQDLEPGVQPEPGPEPGAEPKPGPEPAPGQPPEGETTQEPVT